jgi:guanylate kinase
LLVLSGPSGSGKSSLIARALEVSQAPVELSISATSRPPRPNERDGVHYRFLSRDEFERRRAAGEFLESAEVHGNLYGTPRAPVDAARQGGRIVVLEIDVHGARQVRIACPEARSCFLRAPSLEHYEARLRGRGTETAEAIARRLADAREQLHAAAEYDFQIVNENLDQAVRTFVCLLDGLARQGGICSCTKT